MKKNLIAAAALLAVALVGFCRPALASNCAPYPNTLTNGTTADANQVQTNFNTIMSCANTNLAHNGANTDITSLNSLTTPLSASQGGTGQASSIFSTANAWAGLQTFNGNAAVSGAAGTARSITLQTAGSNRWGLVAGSTAESGSNAGSPFNINAFDDSGNFLSTPFTINRASGVVGMVNGLTAGANAAPFPLQYARFTNTLAQNTGYSPTLGNLGTPTWTTIQLNTTGANTISGASLASNQVTLPAGLYHLDATVPIIGTTATFTAFCQAFNVTDSAVLLNGSETNILGTSGGGDGYVTVTGVFSLSGTKAISVRCGSATGIGAIGATPLNRTVLGAEIYETLTLMRVG